MKSYLFLGLILTGCIAPLSFAEAVSYPSTDFSYQGGSGGYQSRNLNRRVLAQDKDETQQICYDINDSRKQSGTAYPNRLGGTGV